MVFDNKEGWTKTKDKQPRVPENEGIIVNKAPKGRVGAWPLLGIVESFREKKQGVWIEQGSGIDDASSVSTGLDN